MTLWDYLLLNVVAATVWISACILHWCELRSFSHLSQNSLWKFEINQKLRTFRNNEEKIQWPVNVIYFRYLIYLVIKFLSIHDKNQTFSNFLWWSEIFLTGIAKIINLKWIFDHKLGTWKTWKQKRKKSDHTSEKAYGMGCAFILFMCAFENEGG